MKLLSMTAVALLIDISVSLQVIDNDPAFRREPKLPVLDSNFGLDCDTPLSYNSDTVRAAAEKAYISELIMSAISETTSRG
ncbi:CSEP0357 putative effector protein [Blumeria hordei DH14]|uniref:CSEP0357 putative effector protein n=1 Tax=Blumeria graminis f. sp. hordei (strain DH14) TaxID=546991 RepID=N1JF98_BLUG1|nr:CSEP0357 putative effector protein [Blumeria hordei DH14]